METPKDPLFPNISCKRDRLFSLGFTEFSGLKPKGLETWRAEPTWLRKTLVQVLKTPVMG